jgi:methionyl-tRNA synthetase
MIRLSLMTQAGLYRAVNKLEKLVNCCNMRISTTKPWHFRQKTIVNKIMIDKK